VDLTPLELVVQICAAVKRYFEFYFRIGFPEITEYGQVKEFSVDPDPEFILIYLLKLLSEIVIILNQLSGAIVECVAGFSQGTLSCCAVKELHAELFLQLSDVFADSSLSYIALLGCLGKAPAVGSCKEKIKLAKVHTESPPERVYIEVNTM
jgi:hypothetical protein